MQSRNSRFIFALSTSLAAHLLLAAASRFAFLHEAPDQSLTRGSINPSSADYHRREAVMVPLMKWVDLPRPSAEVTHAKPTQLTDAPPRPRDDVKPSKESVAQGVESVPEQRAMPPTVVTASPALKNSIQVFESADYALLSEGRTQGDDDYYFFAEEVDIRIQAIDNIDPQYPPEALTRGIEGRVVIDVLVDERGQVTKREVVYGIPLFSDVAMETIKSVRFIAAVRRQKNVKGRIMIEFLYELTAMSSSK
jgi:TonB family protein